jgi:hypothetical protein
MFTALAAMEPSLVAMEPLLVSIFLAWVAVAAELEEVAVKAMSGAL